MYSVWVWVTLFHRWLLLFQVLMHIADDFIENVISSSCDLAKHRHSDTLEVKDVQMHLERAWNMWIPGFGSEDIRPYRRAPATEAHKQVSGEVAPYLGVLSKSYTSLQCYRVAWLLLLVRKFWQWRLKVASVTLVRRWVEGDVQRGVSNSTLP